MDIIKVENLDFYYDENTHAVKDVSFNIKKGSYTTIIGHNGSGKSTIAKLLLGLLEKKKGSINIDGMDLNLENLYKIRTKVGIVFQNPDNQFIGSTVRDDIAFGLENHCVETEKMDDIINTFSARVGMTEFLDKEPTKLSGGQKQRVAIAGVLAMSPDIIIFDEATSMLDPQGKDEINKAIFHLHDESEITILSITHDIEEVVKSDYVMVMNDGRLLMEGKPNEILTRSQELIDVELDTSFAMKMSKSLKSKGLDINEKTDMEGLVDELCRLNSKN